MLRSFTLWVFILGVLFESLLKSAYAGFGIIVLRPYFPYPHVCLIFGILLLLF